MRIPRVFTTQTLALQETIELEPGPSHHLAKVLRMQTGRELTLFNGTGGEYQGRISGVSKKTVAVVLDQFLPEDRQSPLTLELAIGLSRGDRMDWVLQKATELGVTHISPLFTQRTEVKLGAERLQKKLNHWQQVIVSACEQCERNRLPELATPRPLDDWLSGNHKGLTFVLHHRGESRLTDRQQPTDVAFLVGPEGGLSDREIDSAEAAGCQPLTLGPRVMRTETAPVAAISLAQYLWGDF